jgi:hypothetical protein
MLFVMLVLLLGTEAGTNIYLNKWAVLIKGGPHVADDVAETHGFRNLGQVCNEFCFHGIQKYN